MHGSGTGQKGQRKELASLSERLTFGPGSLHVEKTH